MFYILNILSKIPVLKTLIIRYKNLDLILGKVNELSIILDLSLYMPLLLMRYKQKCDSPQINKVDLAFFPKKS